MRTIVVALLAAMIVLLPLPPVYAADPLVNCRVVVGTQTRVICNAAGLVVLNTAINVPTPAPIVVPGPTRTVTITPKPEVIQEPQKPAATVTKNVPVPGATVTIKEPSKTVTVRPKAVPRPATPEPTKLPETDTGRTGLDRGTLDQRSDEKGIEKILPSPKTVVKGAVSIVALVVLLLLALWAGYYLGYKDKEKQEGNFIRALQDQLLHK